MKIVVNNIDRLLRVELSKICEIVDITGNPKGAFIQWATSDAEDLFNKQTVIIKHCIEQGIPLIIFDKYQKMAPEEVSFLVKPGIFLWEPALNDRMFFSYQPIWGRFPSDIPLFDTDRSVSLGYKGSLRQKVSTFEKYFKPVSDVGQFNVAFFDKHVDTMINQKVMEMGVEIIPNSDLSFDDIKITILLGTDRDYKVGYLDPNFFAYLEEGILPLLPSEHRWYHSIFDGLIVKNASDVNYFLKTHDKIAYGSICDIYKNLMSNLPESDVSNVAKRIKTFFR